MREILTKIISGVLSLMVSAGLVGGVVADVTPEQMYDMVYSNFESFQDEEALRNEMGLSVEDYNALKEQLKGVSEEDLENLDGSELEQYTKLLQFTEEEENILKEMGLWIDWSDFDWGNFSLDAFAKKITFYDKWMEAIDFIDNLPVEMEGVQCPY